MKKGKKSFFCIVAICMSMCEANARLLFGVGGLSMPQADIYTQNKENSNITKNETLNYQGSGINIIGGGLYHFENLRGLSVRGYMSFDYLKGSGHLKTLTRIGLNADVIYDLFITSDFGIGVFVGGEAAINSMNFLENEVASTGGFIPYASGGFRLLALRHHSFECFIKYPMKSFTLQRTQTIQQTTHQYLRDVKFAPIFGLRYVISL
ncbi:hypothetical protein OQH61_09385 [Helicobacter sp. MIT 21-1697]|uniref:hypothetical protein n=1 Tax=Helicobacter sp. MIT 21-1697 TaxID=2993733 RepID=UPI00224AC997|nr:hypothetical protein [Helicobacter sp. MIT 21-1697]MCX2717944.1 hypothetical protein [Helicobacter sp. MIT 21-1697]